MTKAIILSQMQDQMNAAVECVQEERYLEAVGHFNECAQLTQMLQMESAIPTAPEPQQLTIDIPE